MDVNQLSVSLPENVSPWSTYTLQITTPEDKYQGKDDEADRPIHTGPPVSRGYHSSSMISSPSGDVFVFGGTGDTGYLNDTWRIRLSASPSSSAEGDSRSMEVTVSLLDTIGEVPVPRMGHQSALVDGILVMWGGQTPTNGIEGDFKFNDDCIYFLDITACNWTRLNIQPAPSGRFWHAACMCGSRFIVFGGLDVSGQHANDIWAFDLTSLRNTPEWERVDIAPGSPFPPGRVGHTMVAYGDTLYIFGGEIGTTTFGDTWCFDMTTRVWTELVVNTPMPPARAHHAAALVDDTVYIFGGGGEDWKPLEDTWCFKLSEQRWYKLPDTDSQPEATRGHILATMGNRVLIFGGDKSNDVATTGLKPAHILDTSLLIFPKHKEAMARDSLPIFKQPRLTTLTNTPEAVRLAKARITSSSSRLRNNFTSRSLESTGVNLGIDSGVMGLTRAFDNIGLNIFPTNSVKKNTHLDKGTAAPGTADTITGTMSALEILRYLVLHGCHDISGDLDMAQITEYPVSSGGFGDVYYATLRNGERVGLKCLRILVDSTEEGRRYLKRAAHELYVWSKCKHPNILELSGITIFRDQIAMVSPWANHGQLRWFLSRNPQVDRCILCTQIADGVNYLHEQGIVHGDLKPDNVLISRDSSPKLTDFGNAVLSEYTLQFTSSTTNQSMSVRWTAPEILKQETKTTQAGDIFALGMIIFEVITGLLPYAGSSDPVVMFSIAGGKLPDRPQTHVPTGVEQADRLWSLITKCWAYDPNNRPSAREVKEEMKGITQRGLLANLD